MCYCHPMLGDDFNHINTEFNCNQMLQHRPYLVCILLIWSSAFRILEPQLWCYSWAINEVIWIPQYKGLIFYILALSLEVKWKEIQVQIHCTLGSLLVCLGIHHIPPQPSTPFCCLYHLLVNLIIDFCMLLMSSTGTTFAISDKGSMPL